jgi:hypothetical protein
MSWPTVQDRGTATRANFVLTVSRSDHGRLSHGVADLDRIIPKAAVDDNCVNGCRGDTNYSRWAIEHMKVAIVSNDANTIIQLISRDGKHSINKGGGRGRS